MIGVIDTERIKGNQIFLFSYQLYNDDFTLAESKTYHDISSSTFTLKGWSGKSSISEMGTS